MTLANSPLSTGAGGEPDAAQALAVSFFETKLWESATGLNVRGLLLGLGTNASTAKGRVAAFFGERFAPVCSTMTETPQKTRQVAVEVEKDPGAAAVPAPAEGSDPEWTPSERTAEERDEEVPMRSEECNSSEVATPECSLSPGESLIVAHLSWRAAATSLQHSLDVASVYIASAMGGDTPLRWDEIHACDLEKLEDRLDAVLRGLLRGLEACDLRLNRLSVELDCLDDGEAEGLFGSEGKLKEDLEEIQAVRGKVAEFAKRSRHWEASASRALGHIVGIEAISDFVGEAVPTLDEFVAHCGDFAARRRAAVARAKAAIEVADASERATAVAMLQDALSPSSRVDFPRVTEICQRVADRPDEAAPSAAVLWAAMSSSSDSDSESPKKQLKALTIAHELLYDDKVLSAFAALETAPLRGLEKLPPGSVLGKPAEEAVRMLAAEVRRRVEEKQDTVARSSRRRATWSFPSLSRGRSSGAAESSPQQPRLQSSKSAPLEAPPEPDLEGPEALLRQLRRWGSWYHIRGDQERQILGELRQRFLSLLDNLARVAEELDCLDDGSSGIDLRAVVAQLQPFLLSASDLQARACAWCQALEASQQGAGPSSPVATSPLSSGSSVDVEVPTLEPEHLADFLEEALAAFASLSRRLRGCAALRREVVEQAKARIEAGPIDGFEVLPKGDGSGWS